MKRVPSPATERVAALRTSFDGPAWHGPTLPELIADVTPDEAAARPPGVAHGIGTLVAHAAAWKEVVATRLSGEGSTLALREQNFPMVQALDWPEVRDRLERAHRVLEARVRNLPAPALERPLPGEEAFTAREEILGIVAHDLYHAGQVALLKRLLRSGHSEDSSPANSITSERAEGRMSSPTRDGVVRRPGEGRPYHMGRIRAVFKADGEETDHQVSISEWWMEPFTAGPGPHSEDSEFEVFYVLDGTMSFLVGESWHDVAAGSYVVIPPGTQHDFQNRSPTPAGVMNVFTGSFEARMTGIVDWYTDNPPGDTRARGVDEARREAE